jgi:hypothetical protein
MILIWYAWGGVFIILNDGSWCHTLWNACVIFRNAAEQYYFFSKVPHIISAIPCTCSMVECCCRNPNWWSGNILVPSNIRRNLYNIAFSNILPITDSKLIGLYELTSPSGLPGFGVIIICAIFHWARKCPVPVIELHIDVRWTMHFLGNSFNILPVIKSYHGAFLALRSSCIIFLDFLRCKEFDWFYYLRRFFQSSVVFFFESFILLPFVWF